MRLPNQNAKKIRKRRWQDAGQGVNRLTLIVVFDVIFANTSSLVLSESTERVFTVGATFIKLNVPLLWSVDLFSQLCFREKAAASVLLCQTAAFDELWRTTHTFLLIGPIYLQEL